MWFKRRKQAKATPPPAVDSGAYVDLDGDEPIPLVDADNATSLMFELSMNHGAVYVTRNDEGKSIVSIGGRTFTGANDLEALRHAHAVLSRTDR